MILQKLVLDTGINLNKIAGGRLNETDTEITFPRNKKPDIFLKVYHNKDFQWERGRNFYEEVYVNDDAFVDEESLTISRVDLCLNETSDKKRTFDFESLPKKYQKEILYELCAKLEALNIRNED